MILILDNRDSFVFNISRYFNELGERTHVVRSDTASLDDIVGMQPSALVVSPGPCGPVEAGISVPAILHFSGQVPVLGVCLGHQCIAAAFGGTVMRARAPMHGRASEIHHDGRGIFRNLPAPMTAGRYHSLAVSLDGSRDLEACAHSPDGEIMALRHRRHPTHGVQFHPESIMTASGHDLLRRFLELRV